MKTQAQIWSNHKHHNTWKALVGICLNGIVTFVSFLWTDRVSNKEVTNCSGLLEKPEPVNIILAAWGLDIIDILPYGIIFNIPPFKGEKNQLEQEETDETARIAAVRIHAERAIGRIKNYHILNANCPLSMTH